MWDVDDVSIVAHSSLTGKATFVLSPPVDLDVALLHAALNRVWDLDLDSLTYIPLGFGSHHWNAIEKRGQRWFVTVDDLRTGRLGGDPDVAFGAYAAAFGTAAALRDRGLDFVLAPLGNRDGAVLTRLDFNYSLALFPYVDGVSADFGVYRSERDRHDVLRLLGRLHATPPPLELSRREDFSVPKRDLLITALSEVGTPWTSGPFAEPTRQLLRATADNLRTALAHYDDLVAEVRGESSSWVVTHGEPHAANVIRLGEDRLLLIDWDTVAIGPRERDLWMVVEDAASDLAPYSGAGGVPECSATAMALYRLWWELADIAEYVSIFRRPHQRGGNEEASWRYLSRSLPIRAELLR